MTNQHGKQTARVVDEFVATDMGAPFKIVLENCVYVTFSEMGDIVKYNIPDLRGLERSIVLSRATHPKKLNGAELKFLRKLVGVRQRDLAASIDLSPEYVSHVEAGRNVLSPGSEKLARLYLVKSVIELHKQTDAEARAKLERALDAIFKALVPVAACDATDELVMRMVRAPLHKGLRPANDTDLFDGWSDQPTVVNQR